VGDAPVLPHDMCFWAGPSAGGRVSTHQHEASRGITRSFAMLPGLMLARSAGTLKLASSDPTEQPHITLNYLDDPTDVARLREGVRLSLELAAGPELSKVIRAVKSS
jgi:choline dehydrogenase-like flavoprotein